MPQLCLHIQKYQLAAARRQQIKQNAAPRVQPVGQGDAQILPRAQLRQRTAMIYDRQRPGRPQQRREQPPGRLLSRIFCCARSKTASVTRQTTLT